MNEAEIEELMPIREEIARYCRTDHTPAVKAAVAAARAAMISKVLPGYRESRGRICTKRLFRQHCRLTPQCSDPHLPPGADHTSLWFTSRRQMVLVTQPYDQENGLRIKDMRGWAAQHGLSIEVSTVKSWWNPGYTVYVAFMLEAPK